MGRSTPFEKRAVNIRRANSERRANQPKATAPRPFVSIGGNFGSVTVTTDGTTPWVQSFDSSGTVEHATFRATALSGPVTAIALLNGERVSERLVAAGDSPLGGSLAVKAGDMVELLLMSEKDEVVENAGIIAFFREAR